MRQAKPAMLTVADMGASFGSRLSMAIDKNERSNRGGAGGIIGDFLSTGKELDGNTKINLKKPKLASRQGPRRKPSVRPGAVYKLLK